MSNKLHIVHALGIEFEITREQSIYAPRNTIYTFLNQNSTLVLKDAYRAEKEKMEWIRKYEHVLKGLNYCKRRLGYK